MTHLQREVDRLKRKILALGALVEDNLRLAFQAIEARDSDKAHRVMVTDILIDDQEVEVEEECLKILALKSKYTIVLVTHNMQQAARVSDYTAFFFQGRIVEFGPTTKIFSNPAEKQTEEYITGRFG